MARVFINLDRSGQYRLIHPGDTITTSNDGYGYKYAFVAIAGDNVIYRTLEPYENSYGCVAPGNFCNGRIIDETDIIDYIPSMITINTERRIP